MFVEKVFSIFQENLVPMLSLEFPWLSVKLERLRRYVQSQKMFPFIKYLIMYFPTCEF